MSNARNLPTDVTTATDGGSPTKFPSAKEVLRVLELVRPAVREDGGDVEFVSIDDDGLVKVRFHGACVGCPSAGMTLHHGIERALRTELGAGIRVESVP